LRQKNILTLGTLATVRKIGDNAMIDVSSFQRVMQTPPISYPWPDQTDARIKQLESECDEWQAKAEMYREKACSFLCIARIAKHLCQADSDCPQRIDGGWCEYLIAVVDEEENNV
jgi:hypothetical protein